MNSGKNLKDKKKKKSLLSNFCYDFVKITGAVPMYLYMRPKIYRPYGTKTPKGRVMISANHKSMFDPVIVHVVFPWRRLNCLATKDLFNTKVKSRFFNLMKCIVVDKENFSLSSFHEVVERLQENKAVVIFPEGGLNRDSDDSIHTFKSGATLMAYRAKAPILPIYIVKREKWYQRQHIVVGEPVEFDYSGGLMPSLEQLNEASEKLRKSEIELREYFKSLPIYKKYYKKEENTMVNEGEMKDEQKV